LYAAANREQLENDLKPVAVAVTVMSFFLNLLILPISLYSLQVLDRVMSTGSIETLLWLTLMMAVSFVAVGLLQTFRSMVLIRGADWLHENLTRLALPLVLSQAAAGGRGAQHLRDAATIRQFLAGNGLSSLLDAPWSVIYVAVLFVIHPSLGMLVIAGAAILLLLAWLNEAAMRGPLKESNQKHVRGMQELEAATRNAEVTEAMGMGAALASRWQAMQAGVTALQAQAGDRSSLIQGATKFARLSLQVLVTALSAWLALKGDVTVGAIIAASILASRALAPFESAIGSWKLLADVRAAYARLAEIFSADSQRDESMSLPEPEGHLTVEHLTFTVEGRERPILADISFGLHAGESLGIIGASGSGKSTLARLITGARAPASGVARLDGADVYRWPRAEFGRHVGYIPQDGELFSGTVKDNICRFREEATPEAIVRAAQMAGAHDLILRLPNGYETEIGTGGAFLSAGQRQRIGLARAFFGDPRLLVMDEPDANLDETGQHALQSALHLAKQRRITTILITHRRSLLSQVDKLLVLRGGGQDMFGPAQQVIAALAARQRAQTPEAAEA
jgi:PrtD family type I secretion system ABC transporter